MDQLSLTLPCYLFLHMHLRPGPTQVNAFFLDLEVHKAQAGTGDNHAVSAMKFGILKQFIELGYSVLLSDVDIVVVQNPFPHLYR